MTPAIRTQRDLDEAMLAALLKPGDLDPVYAQDDSIRKTSFEVGYQVDVCSGMSPDPRETLRKDL